jgi:hypothetical protein
MPRDEIDYLQATLVPPHPTKMFAFSVLAALVLAAIGANAHATFQYLGVNGADQGTKCVRQPQGPAPITSPSGNVSSNIVLPMQLTDDLCRPSLVTSMETSRLGASATLTYVYLTGLRYTQTLMFWFDMQAGDELYMEMHEQLGAQGCALIALGAGHYGPTLIYMAKVDSAKMSTPWTANWFKVAQVGLITPGP